MTYQLKTFAQTTIAGSVLSGATTATVATGTGAQWSGASTTAPIRYVVTNAATSPETLVEIGDVVGQSGDTLTLANRGAEGTTASAWSTGYTISANATAAVLAEMQTAIAPAALYARAILR